MRRSLMNLALVFLLLFGLNAYAQDDDMEERDILELSAFGGLALPSGGLSDFSDSLGAKTGWLLGLDFGYFVTPDIVLGVNFTYCQFAVDTDTEAKELNHRLYNPSLYLKYYFFGEGNFAPYLKGHVGIDNTKFATFLADPARFRELSYDPAFAFGIGCGLFFYTSDYSGLFFEANYHNSFAEDAEKEYQGNTYIVGDNYGVIDIHAGISVFFGSDE